MCVNLIYSDLLRNYIWYFLVCIGLVEASKENNCNYSIKIWWYESEETTLCPNFSKGIKPLKLWWGRFLIKSHYISWGTMWVHRFVAYVAEISTPLSGDEVLYMCGWVRFHAWMCTRMHGLQVMNSVQGPDREEEGRVTISMASQEDSGMIEGLFGQALAHCCWVIAPLLSFASASASTIYCNVHFISSLWPGVSGGSCQIPLHKGQINRWTWGEFFVRLTLAELCLALVG